MAGLNILIQEADRFDCSYSAVAVLFLLFFTPSQPSIQNYLPRCNQMTPPLCLCAEHYRNTNISLCFSLIKLCFPHWFCVRTQELHTMLCENLRGKTESFSVN